MFCVRVLLFRSHLTFKSCIKKALSTSCKVSYDTHTKYCSTHTNNNKKCNKLSLCAVFDQNNNCYNFVNYTLLHLKLNHKCLPFSTDLYTLR